MRILHFAVHDYVSSPSSRHLAWVEVRSRTQMQLPFIFQAWKCPNTYYIFLLWQKPLNSSQVLRKNAGRLLMKDWLTKIHRAGEPSPSARGAQEMAGQKWRDFPYQSSFTMRSLWGRYNLPRYMHWPRLSAAARSPLDLEQGTTYIENP